MSYICNNNKNSMSNIGNYNIGISSIGNYNIGNIVQWLHAGALDAHAGALRALDAHAT